MKTQYAEIEKILRQAVQARQDTKQTIAKLNAQSKDYSPEYVKVSIEPQIAKAQSGLKAQYQTGYEKVAALLQDLAKMTTEKHSKLNLENPAWQNALKLIELSGKDIDAETVRKINASFATDQSALRALRGIYKAKGVLYDGGLDKQIYEPETAFEKLGEWAYASMIQEGSLNEFASEISKVAAKEGIDFPPMVDEVGATNAMRRAAGLPV